MVDLEGQNALFGRYVAGFLENVTFYALTSDR